jgi:hypothetical protein
MSARLINALVGLVLIAAGLLFLAQNLGYMGELTPLAWMVISAGLSLLFLVAYFVNGWQSWPWLIPAGVFAGLAGTIFLGEAGATGTLVPVPLFAGILLPFLAAYLIDRQENWWALIPAWAMLVVTLIVVLAERIPGELIATVVMFGIGLPFLFVYLRNRAHWWALIPGLIMCGIGLALAFASQAQGNLVAALILLAVAAPFILIYLISADNWWALIPAGILASISLALGFLGDADEASMEVWFNVFILGGMALTFFGLWLRRARTPTGWAIWPALLCVAGAVAAGVLRINIFDFWPVMLVVAGLLLLYTGLRARGTHGQEG